MKDLTKILKVGDEVYCTLTGGYVKVTDIELLLGGPIFKIYSEAGNRSFYITETGHFYPDYPDAEPVIYPSKENRDWDTWNPIRQGDMVLAWNNNNRGFKYISIYWKKTHNKHIVLYRISKYNLEMCEESCDHVERLTPEMIEEFLKQADQ